MKREKVSVRAWILRGGGIFLGAVFVVGTLLWVFSGSSHNPNHDINMEQARAAAARVHKPPKPGEKIVPGAGG